MIGRPLTANQSIVYRAIESAAKAGAPCPTNEELCGELGAASPATPAYTVRMLETFGLIAIEGAGRRRRVTVTATGQVTA